MRRLNDCLIGAIVAVWLMSPAFAQTPTQPPAQPPAKPDIANISVLYTGDTHGHLRSFYFESNKPVGGVAKRAIFFQEKRRHKKMIWLTLDSGDAISGSPLSDVFQGFLDIEAMNRLGYDAMALGVHEFDYGLPVLKQRITEAKFPILCANVTYTDTGKPLAKPYTFIERGGMKIAVLGLITGEVAKRVAPENFAGLSVADPVDTARGLVPELKRQADLVVAVTHLGVNEDIRLASQVPQIDLIVGGMSHSELQVPIKVVDTMIVHDAYYGRTVGVLKLSYSRQPSGYKRHFYDCMLLPLDGKWAENSQYVTWLNEYQPQMAELMGTLIGSSAVSMSSLKIRSSETELGNYVCDVLREATKSDVAILPAAFFNAPLPAGPVTLGDLFTTMPFDQYAVILNVTGGELKEILDAAADQIGKPGFPQVSGMSFGIYNGKSYNVRVAGKEVDPFTRYRLVTSDVLSGGAYGYSTMGTVTDIEYTGRMIRELVRHQLASGVQASSSMYQRILFLASQPMVAPESKPEEEAGTELAAATEPESEASAETAPAEAPAETPAEASPAEAPATPPDESESAPPPENGDLDATKYDRTGEPLDKGETIKDEVVTDSESDTASPPGEPSSVDQPAAPEPEGSTETPFAGEKPVLSSGELGAPAGRAEAVQGGLNYELLLLPKADRGYKFILRVSNTSSTSVDLAFPTYEQFDFMVYDGTSLKWHYNFNRIFIQSAKTDTIMPGDKREYSADWDGLAGDKTELKAGTYRFETEYKLTENPVRLTFDAALPE